MCNTNGKTERVTRKRDEADSTLVSRREGSSTAQSSTTGLQRHFQNDQGVSDRGDRCEHRQFPGSAAGKILERLENLEKRFFSYAKAHQERLDLRKRESEIAVEEFAIEAASLKQDLINILQDQEQQTENS